MGKISTTKTSDLPDILTAREIAWYLGIGYNKALRLIQHGGNTLFEGE